MFASRQRQEAYGHGPEQPQAMTVLAELGLRRGTSVCHRTCQHTGQAGLLNRHPRRPCLGEMGVPRGGLCRGLVDGAHPAGPRPPRGAGRGLSGAGGPQPGLAPGRGCRQTLCPGARASACGAELTASHSPKVREQVQCKCWRVGSSRKPCLPDGSAEPGGGCAHLLPPVWQPGRAETTQGLGWQGKGARREQVELPSSGRACSQTCQGAPSTGLGNQRWQRSRRLHRHSSSGQRRTPHEEGARMMAVERTEDQSTRWPSGAPGGIQVAQLSAR